MHHRPRGLNHTNPSLFATAIAIGDVGPARLTSLMPREEVHAKVEA